jgi:hypothetical protein
MNEFLLLHDNESGGKPATVRKSIISLILPSEDYSEGSAIFIKDDDEEPMILEAKESVEEIYNMLND